MKEMPPPPTNFPLSDIRFLELRTMDSQPGVESVVEWVDTRTGKIVSGDGGSDIPPRHVCQKPPPKT